jgi:SAM-dependent methyltransferase
MKPEHVAFLRSERWAHMLQQDLLPWLLEGGTLGDAVLEIGPGPGHTTALLQQLAPSVTAVELDPALAEQLRARITDPRVHIVRADAAHTPFPSDHFSAVACFHMLHHVPTPAEQDAVLAEAARLLVPGGRLLCADALDTEPVRAAHEQQGETFVPLDANTLAKRLTNLGFCDIEVREAHYQLLIRARRVRRVI